MESKPSLKKTKAEGRQLWVAFGSTLIVLLGVLAVWPWLRTVIWPHQEVELYFSKPQGLYLGAKRGRSTPAANLCLARLWGRFSAGRRATN